MLRDRLLARLAEMGAAPDHQRLAAEVLGIRGAPPELARRLVAQALVLEDRRETWRRAGERICRDAPATPGVYVLKDAGGRALYVGKAVNLRRRLRAHFADRRWRAIKPEMSRADDAEWQEVGSELEALLREAALIHELQPPVNVQTAAPDSEHARGPARARARRPGPRAVGRSGFRRADWRGRRRRWMIQRTRRNGADLAVHAQRVMRFFNGAAPPRATPSLALAPIVFSWLHRRGRSGDAARPARRPRRARAARAPRRAAARRAPVPRAPGTASLAVAAPAAFRHPQSLC